MFPFRLVQAPFFPPLVVACVLDFPSLSSEIFLFPQIGKRPSFQYLSRRGVWVALSLMTYASKTSPAFSLMSIADTSLFSFGHRLSLLRGQKAPQEAEPIPLCGFLPSVNMDSSLRSASLLAGTIRAPPTCSSYSLSPFSPCR